ncbi:MAG: MFS transporter, partial [Alphaproteobacteria bacterium]
MSVAAVATSASETRVLSLIGIGHFLSHFYILCLPPMLPLLAREFNVGYALLGGAIAGYAWIGGILQAQIGAALDWIGARQMLAAGLAINAFAIAMIGFADTFWQFAALAVIAGVGNSVFHPVDYAIIAAKVVEK